MKKIALITALAATLTTTALAQSDTIIRSVTLDDLEAVVSAESHTVTERDDETSTLSAQDENGLNYQLNATACDTDQNCKGINIIVAYELSADVSPMSLNEADRRYAAASVWHTDTAIGISRYVILDGGMTTENIGYNLRNILTLAPKVLTAAKEEAASEASTNDGEIDFGNDTGDYANDGDCDDARFFTDGEDWNYKRQHVMHDATDCRAKVDEGNLSLILDFGDNSGEYADDGTCDDVRFEGEGRSILNTDSHIKTDSADCIAAFQTGTISLR